MALVIFRIGVQRNALPLNSKPRSAGNYRSGSRTDIPGCELLRLWVPTDKRKIREYEEGPTKPNQTKPFWSAEGTPLNKIEHFYLIKDRIIRTFLKVYTSINNSTSKLDDLFSSSFCIGPEAVRRPKVAIQNASTYFMKKLQLEHKKSELCSAPQVKWFVVNDIGGNVFGFQSK